MLQGVRDEYFLADIPICKISDFGIRTRTFGKYNYTVGNAPHNLFKSSEVNAGRSFVKVRWPECVFSKDWYHGREFSFGPVKKPTSHRPAPVLAPPTHENDVFVPLAENRLRLEYRSDFFEQMLSGLVSKKSCHSEIASYQAWRIRDPPG